MSFVHGKTASLIYGIAYDLANYLNNIEISNSVDPAETTVFGDNNRTYIAGLRDGTIAASGLWDASSDASDEEFQAGLDQTYPYIGISTTTNINSAYPDPTTNCWFGRVKDIKYDISNPVDGVVSCTADFQSNGGLFPGINVYGRLSTAASGALTGIDNGASTSNGYCGQLHVFSRSGTQTYKIQHSPDNSVWADLISWSVTAVGVQQTVSTTGTVDRYIRMNRTTTSGTAHTTMFFSRRGSN